MYTCEPHPVGHYVWGVRSPSFLGLGFFRPNQAINRGIYRAYGMGQDTTAAVDLPTLALGVGALAAAFFLLGGKTIPKIRKRRVHRLRRKLAALEAST